jgi:hypothetical protein
LDYLNAERVRSSFIPEEEGKYQDIKYDIKRYIEGDAIIKDIKFSGARVNGRNKYSERVKLYDLSWFEEEMQSRGLQIDQVYGDYEGGVFEPETSTRLLIIGHLSKS